MDLYKCPVCERLSYDRIRCSICSKYACLSCMGGYQGVTEQNLQQYQMILQAEICPKEWEIYRRVCGTYRDQLVCTGCFSTRTLEILRGYPIETAGLLVNATLLPLAAIRARLSEG